jgi:hypothetical protein
MASSDPPSGGDREVLASLPNSRPTRRSAKRDRAPRGRGAGAATEGPAKPARASAGAAPKGGAKAVPKAKPRAGRTTAKPGAGRTTAKPGAGRTTAKPGAGRTTAKRAAAAKAAPIPPAGYATPRADDDGLRGADLVTTAVQAAGELAHIGIAAGGRALKSALQRLPRP